MYMARRILLRKYCRRLHGTGTVSGNWTSTGKQACGNTGSWIWKRRKSLPIVLKKNCILPFTDLIHPFRQGFSRAGWRLICGKSVCCKFRKAVNFFLLFADICYSRPSVFLTGGGSFSSACVGGPAGMPQTDLQQDFREDDQ